MIEKEARTWFLVRAKRSEQITPGVVVVVGTCVMFSFPFSFSYMPGIFRPGHVKQTYDNLMWR